MVSSATVDLCRNRRKQLFFNKPSCLIKVRAIDTVKSVPCVIMIKSLTLHKVKRYSSQVKSCDKRVQTPGMSPPRAGAWTYCLFTP